MSRLTAAQVISLGEYLSPDFDPASLTVSQLLGVLGFHNIRYPSPYTKPKLVQLFNEEIKPKHKKLNRERLKKENSQASDDGIIDGVTGVPISRETAPPVRRSSRRSSRAPTEDRSPTRADPPKRRRSSAQPTLGGPSRKAAPPVEPAVLEESEPEEEEMPARKVGRSKKTNEAAGSQARRVSTHDDSGWEDNNIFQSGAESSSPARPSPAKPKSTRRSIAPTARKSHKASSAPPQMSPPSSPSRPFHPPESKFEPQLPSNIARGKQVPTSARKSSTGFAPVEHVPAPKDEEAEDDELNLMEGDNGVGEEDELSAVPEHDYENESAEALHDQDEDVDEIHANAVTQRIAQGGKLARRRSIAPAPQAPRSLWLRTLYTLLFLLTSAGVLNYKLESTPVGYCDTGRQTNDVLEGLKVKWQAEEACNFENRTLLHLPPLAGGAQDETPCPPLALIPIPHPTSCTPCPEHATCTQHSVACETGYLLRSHPLLFTLPATPNTAASIELSSSLPPSTLVYKLLSEVVDGLPGLGSVAFPPRCVEDPKRKRNIGALGKAMESMLGQLRGKRICDRGVREFVKDRDGGEAKRWGVAIEELKDAMQKKTPPQLLATFDDTFNEAVQQLVQWGGVFISEDSAGKRYVAHKTPNLTWDCALTVKSREVWAEWRRSVIGVFLSIIAFYAAKYQRASRKRESKRIAELVQIALDTLYNQELAHHTDPVTAPQPYLSSLQLRDLILQDEHSIPMRRRLWDQVERVVEGNANVRANLEEVQGGDELRVWRWVGSAGRRHVQFENANDKGGAEHTLESGA
ncbi:hypothetical protein PLICRDRAFT_161764 [Plicaturopsis crispa FD-325 SS-3]|nr:hypothetical protein PLICRDRAFT_161764 [Plicaturopsis crispa FD-325 SS-3]